MNINKGLLEGDKLTKRGMQNQRARLAKLGSLCGNLIEGVLTRSVHCKECQDEFNPGNTITKVELDTIKLVYAKTLSDVSASDTDSVTDEPKTKEEVSSSIATMLKDKALIRGVAETHYNVVVELRDYLIELTRNVDKIGSTVKADNDTSNGKPNKESTIYSVL